MRKYRKAILILWIFGFTIIMCNQVWIAQSQTEQQASAAIQEAENKLIYALELLEDFPNYDVDSRNIIMQIDTARQLIKEAKDNFDSSNFTVSYQKATTASLELDTIIEEIQNKTQTQSRNKTIIFSFVGVVSGFAAILFGFFFINKIYPWFEKKKIEEYGKLEIKYDNSRGDSK